MWRSIDGEQGGIDEERAESTKRRWNRRREGGIDEERIESTEREEKQRRKDGS
ncbi:hypothetical protein NSQ54_06525 [Alkalihalobacillus sp. FSL W8-0930]